MPRYHVNDKTGNAGVCRAEKSCPFGDMQADHYETPEAARDAYEKQQNLELVGVTSPRSTSHGGSFEELRYRADVKSATERVGFDLAFSPLDSFIGPKATAYFAISEAADNTDWDSTDSVAEAERVMRAEADRLRELASNENVQKWSGRRNATRLEEWAGKIESNLPSANDEDEEPRVPCDERHAMRIELRGFCPKCGGAQ